MQNLIESKLKESGIDTTIKSNENMVSLIESAIETVRLFGKEYWLNETSTGAKIKKIVFELA